MLRISPYRTAWIVLTLALAGSSPFVPSLAENPSPPTGKWTAAFVQAEIAGDSATRKNILLNALQSNPDLAAARWQLGEIQVDGDWQPVNVIQQTVASDPRQREYAALRGSSGDTPEAHLALARWCVKNGLKEEAGFHWMCVLMVDPNFEEAQRALDVRPFNGQLMTQEAIERLKKEVSAKEGSVRAWSNRVAKWEAAMKGDLAERTAALREVSTADAYACIPAIERVTLDAKIKNDLELVRRRQLSMAFLDALERMGSPAAVQSLVRHAVLSPLEVVRESAVNRLKERPMHDYVPYLLDGLAMPIESKFYVMRSPDGSVQYGHELYRQGAFADWSFNASHHFVQQDLQGRVYVSSRRQGFTNRDFGPVAKSDVEVAQDALQQSYFAARNLSSHAAGLEQRLHRYNVAVVESNSRIHPILATTTGQDFGINASDWWDWWRDYSEYDTSVETPVYSFYYHDSSAYFHRPSEYYLASCFVAGTPVWTKTGLRPIESIQKGDLVLAKNVDSGELAFKPVIATTTRPPSSIINLKFGDDQIGATRGHPFWVNGEGWRMAKQLTVGNVAHGVKGPMCLNVAADNTEKAEAYNLVVADFNTYFVGESGMLVHDNTPVRPTAAVVPGLAK